MANEYVTLEEFKAALQIGEGDTTDDAVAALALESASRAIDDYCGRTFYGVADTRRYTARDSTFVMVDEFYDAGALMTDEDGDGIMDTEWDAPDNERWPRNAMSRGEPYRGIVVTLTGTKRFPLHRNAVELSSTFGWVPCPPAIKQATFILASRLFKRRDAPFGVAGANAFGQLTVIRAEDAGVMALITPYRRLEFAT